MADIGPEEYSAVGQNQYPRYHNPNTSAPNAADGPPASGYLGDSIGPREIQTGNAPSGGYTTLPGLGFTANQYGVVGVNPDNRRAAAVNRTDDWETNQAAINRWAIGGNQDARRDVVRLNDEETFVNYGHLPMPSHQVNAITDSPYRRDWPEPDRLTMRNNPNQYRYRNDYDRADVQRNSGTRYVNGTHFSFAEHNTLTPYKDQQGGSQPVRALRNTYRITPAAWDADNTDSPSNNPSYTQTVNLAGGGEYPASYML
jgi:hypothetical protein